MINNLKFKFQLLNLLTIFVIIIIGIYSVFSFSAIENKIEGLITNNYKSLEVLFKMNESLQIQEKNIYKYILLENTTYLDKYHRESKEFNNYFNFQKRNITEEGEKELVDAIEEKYTSFEIKLFLLKDTGQRKKEELIEFYNTEIKNLKENIHQDIDKLILINEKAMFEYKTIVERSIRKSKNQIVVIYIIIFLSAIFVLNYMLKKFLKPIDILVDSMKSMKENEFSLRAPIVSNDEIGKLTKEFNLMAERIEKYEKSTKNLLISEKNKSYTIVNTIPDPIIIVDKNMKLKIINSSAKENFNINESNDYNKPIYDLIDNMNVYSFISKYIKDNTADNTKVFKFFINNEDMFFNVRLGEVLDIDNRLYGFVLIFQNITSYKKLELMKYNLISTISHEFKTPLTSIIMGVNLLKEEKLGELTNKQKNIIVTIEEESRKIENMIDELMQVKNIKSADEIFDFKVTSINIIINYCISNFIKIAKEEKKILYFKDIDKNFPSILADPEKLKIVINNLISNSLKYTNEGDEIIINTYVKDEKLYVKISDTGLGVNSSEVENIFDKFYSIKLNDKKGTGLGLALCKEIIEEHGGEIWAESSQNKGFTVIFYLNI